VEVEHVVWTCELRYHEEGGVEARLFRAGELVMGHRFTLREQAVKWADEMKTATLQRRIDAVGEEF